MRVFNNLQEINITGAIATIGFFDGVHAGHSQILKRIVTSANELKLSSLVITFWPHPRLVLGKDTEDLRLLSSLPEKVELIKNQGVDSLLILEFNSDLAAVTAQDFVQRILVGKLGVKGLFVGYNHNFGRFGQGNYELLKEMETEGGYIAHQIEPISVDDIKVSSSKIRSALERGNVILANRMLGRPYSITGTIEGGMQIGRSIGYPTANISPSEPLKQIPGFGVYAVWVDYKGVEYPAMLNIGVKPTVGYNLDRTIEAHIIGFEENIYNEEITVRFVDRLRDEMKFPSIQHLKNQLEVDRDHAIKVLDYSKK